MMQSFQPLSSLSNQPQMNTLNNFSSINGLGSNLPYFPNAPFNAYGLNPSIRSNVNYNTSNNSSTSSVSSGTNISTSGNSNAGSVGSMSSSSTPPGDSSDFYHRLQSLLPAPPLIKCANRQTMTINVSQKRAKRKSKFSKVQDDLIVELKHSGKNWAEIADITKVGSYLAARNRYQVIVGQQGNNNSSSWDDNDNYLLKTLLDKYEVAKWRYITNELNKVTNKNYEVEEVQQLLCQLVYLNPSSFGLTENLITELMKERRVTEKSMSSGTFKSDVNDYFSFP